MFSVIITLFRGIITPQKDKNTPGIGIFALQITGNAA